MSYTGFLLMGLSQTFSHQCRKNLVSSCEINTLHGFMNKYTCIMGKRISKQSLFLHIFNHMLVRLPTIMSLYFNIKEMRYCGFSPPFLYSFHREIADKGKLQYCLDGRRESMGWVIRDIMIRGVRTEQEIRHWSFSDLYLFQSKLSGRGRSWESGVEGGNAQLALLWHYLRKQHSYSLRYNMYLKMCIF